MTVLIPAYNEAASIADTIDSLFDQTVLPARIIVIDDGSTDETTAIARAHGAEVMHPPSNTGSKAGAQSFALPEVDTEYTMAIDADTVLARDALELLAPAFDEEDVAAACGFVLPRHTRSLWERGRYVEYLYAFTFPKVVQDLYGNPLISSGCFSMYRTSVLRSLGGWAQRTMAEDMDLTWTLNEQGWRVRFLPQAVSYPIEPHDFDFMSKQLRRWSHGFVQNVTLHWRGLLGLRYLRSVIAVGFFDAVVSPIITMVVLPLLAIMVSPLFLLGYLIDVPVIAVPVLVAAARRHELARALVSLPAFVVVRLVNSWFMVAAMASELVLRRTLDVYEKGH